MPLALIDSTRNGFQGRRENRKAHGGGEDRYELAFRLGMNEAVFVVGAVNGNMAVGARPDRCRCVSCGDFRLVRKS